MKRRIKFTACVLLVLLFALFTFVACSGNEDNSNHTHTLVHYEAVESTCTEKGNIEYWFCSDCNKKYSDAGAKNEVTEVIISLNHSGGTEIRGEKAPTLEAEGYTGDTYCLGCGEKVSSGESTPKLDHLHDMTKTERVEANCTEDGNIEYYTCTICKKIYTDNDGIYLISATDVVIKAGHDLSSTQAKAPSCTEIGWNAYDSCSKCDYSTYEETATLGHDYADGVCTRCGKKEIEYSEGLKFVSNGDGTCYVEGIGTCTDTDIVIPPKSPEGHDVTSIGQSAFFGCKSITSVKIPSSITASGVSAFYGCTGLKSVYINDITAWCGIAFKAYSNPLFFAHKLYLNGELVTDLIIPGSVTEIGNSVFDGCSTLTSVTIPEGVTEIGYNAFRYCTNLTNITVNENNSEYKSIGGNLYTKDGKTLIQYAIGKTETSFIIPDSVTKIDWYAFYKCTSLTSVTIPNSVTTIGDEAFNCCDKLTSVTIPDSVTSIGDFAFSDCQSLTSVKIGDNVKTVGVYAFAYCTNITSVTISESVTEVGFYAFKGCTSLASVTLGGGLREIGASAFENCTSLTNIEFKNTSDWFVSEEWNATSGTAVDVTDTAQNAIYITSTYCDYYWKRADNAE